MSWRESLHQDRCEILRVKREWTHWGRVAHVYVSKLTITGSDNGRRQAITWTNADILLIRTSGTNFSEISNEIHTFSFKEMPLKMSSGKSWWRPFCLGANVLTTLFKLFKPNSSQIIQIINKCMNKWTNTAWRHVITRDMMNKWMNKKNHINK